MIIRRVYCHWWWSDRF